MHSTIPLLSFIVTFFYPYVTSAETTLGLYIFSRHGDRTSKSTPPTNLTTLGYSQIFSSGSSFRSRYVASDASSPILGLSHDTVNFKQIYVSAPLDTVLMPSAQGFLQGLYPPLGTNDVASQQQLRNRSEVQTPLDGYQLIPIDTVATGTASETSAWLQGASNCRDAITSSDRYFSSSEYDKMMESTEDFYKGLAPVVNATFREDYLTYKNAYAIYDLINVAQIHNRTIPSSDLLTPSALTRLQTLANTHELELAYNASDTIRAIAGSTLAAQVLQALNNTLTAPKSAPKITVQFGAYGSFLSFFGLAGLTASGDRFTTIPDYASAMAFELVTNATTSTSSFPDSKDINVRFLYRDGPAGSDNELEAYPLFAQSETTLRWNDFVERMNGIAVGDQRAWCAACGNSTGVCAVQGASEPVGAAGTKGSGGLSNAVAGVIGALVALAVVLGAEALVMLGSGLRVVRKSKGAQRDEKDSDRS